MSLLKQYTLRVVVMVGGDDESECEERINRIMDMIDFGYQVTTEITHEEVLHNEEDPDYPDLTVDDAKEIMESPSEEVERE